MNGPQWSRHGGSASLWSVSPAWLTYNFASVNHRSHLCRIKQGIGATLAGAAFWSVNRTQQSGARPAAPIAKLLLRPPLRTPFILA
jgi:hypothetical protein